jgi:GNAT superfamily N-acetyltransferase
VNSTKPEAAIRSAHTGDAATIAWHRAAMFREMGDLPAEDFELLRNASEDWLRGLLLRELWPAPGCCRVGRWANVGNVYTEPGHRRRGLARSVMEVILEWCRSNAIDYVTLAASREGRPLYESLEFEADGMAMKLRRRID